MPSKNSVAALKAKIAQLESELARTRPAREKIDQMSSEVVSSNPYSRLMALQKMGIVDNYAQYVGRLFCTTSRFIKRYELF